MLKKLKEKKGFTLIELLAVIVILGILMIIAIPQVTKYIENSKKDTYADTAKSYINSARYMLLNDEFETCTLPEDGDSAIYIALNAIYLEQGGEKSPYSKDIDLHNSFVKVEKNSAQEKYTYSIFITDAQKNGTKALTDETKLTRAAISKKGAPSSISHSEFCAKEKPKDKVTNDTKTK